MYNMMNIINTAVHYKKDVKRANPNSSYHKGKKPFSYFFNVVPMSWWWMLITTLTVVIIIMMYVSQIIMQYNVNLYNAICQL